MAKVFTITEGLENMGALKTGGQGSVYKGRRIGEIITAIKLLPTPIYAESIADKNFMSFKNEVEKLKKVNENPNPHVVKILSSGITETGNFPFIEMEYVNGPDLEELLKPPHNPIFPIKEVLKVADQLSNALAHCHKVDVKHGDVKSNNVKFDTRTGNYILLDFGLSVMSDEERRTSLRHAGAIEFMAPEQNEGQMLFQTDVYSFGVILFELLAGTVPFPLRDKGEISRNAVMVAHMETPVPDLMDLRREAMPTNWDYFKKEAEAKVPAWLIDGIEKCLEKNPEQRFKNGMELHRYICEHSIGSTGYVENADEQITLLLQENQRLLREKEALQQQLLQYQQPSNKTNDHSFQHASIPSFTSAKPQPVATKSSLKKSVLIFTAIVAAIIILVVALIQAGLPSSKSKSTPTVAAKNIEKRNAIAQYKVAAAKAYFYNQPQNRTRRDAYAVPSDEVIKAYDDKNGFIYTQIVNDKNQVSKGWLRKQDLTTLEEGNKNIGTQGSNSEVNDKLKQARQLLNNQQVDEALEMYKTLAEQQVPEAMYEYADLALKNENSNIDCADAFELLINAEGKGYAPAKRTLGFLYAFADNEDILRSNNYYERCSFNKNTAEGSKLLMEAMLQGDTASARWLNQLNSTAKQ